MMPEKPNWKKLEDRITDLLKADSARTTPGSGNSKEEEDVVGKSTICQCKDSDNKNITILTKDIERLKESAKLLDKTPLFASRAGKHTLISMVLDDDNLETVLYALNNLIVMSRIKYVQSLLENNTSSVELVSKISHEFESVTAASNMSSAIFKEHMSAVQTSLDVMIANTMMYDLFGEHNAPQ